MVWQCSQSKDTAVPPNCCMDEALLLHSCSLVTAVCRRIVYPFFLAMLFFFYPPIKECRRFPEVHYSYETSCGAFYSFRPFQMCRGRCEFYNVSFEEKAGGGGAFSNNTVVASKFTEKYWRLQRLLRPRAASRSSHLD